MYKQVTDITDSDQTVLAHIGVLTVTIIATWTFLHVTTTISVFTTMAVLINHSLSPGVKKTTFVDSHIN